MDAAGRYKLERYRSAFIDYEASIRKFHEGVLELALRDGAAGISIKTLAYELNVKHKYFVECASRLTGLD